MANETVEWVEVPWRQPSKASVDAILERLGLAAATGSGLDRASIDPSVIETLSGQDNQILSAAGVFGDPVSHPFKGADYSKFSGVVGEGSGDEITYHVFRNGEEIAKRTGDGLLDTVALWNEVAG